MLMAQGFTTNAAWAISRKALWLLGLRRVNENGLSDCLIRDRNEPVATATILTTNAVHKSSMNVAFRIHNAGILTSNHGRENSIEAVPTNRVG